MQAIMPTAAAPRPRAGHAVVRSNACRLRHLCVAGYRQLPLLAGTMRPVRGHPQHSLFRKTNSLIEQKDSLFHGVQGIACKTLERLRN